MPQSAVIKESDLITKRVQVGQQLDVNMYINHTPTDRVEEGVDNVLITANAFEKGTDDVNITAGVGQPNAYAEAKIIYS